MKRPNRVAGKALAMFPLQIKILEISVAMKADPEYKQAMAERQQYLDAGALWLTPLALKFATMEAVLAQLESTLHAIRATPSAHFRPDGRIDKRRARRGRGKVIKLYLNKGGLNAR